MKNTKIAILAVLALVLTACASEGDDATTTTVAETTTTEAMAEETTTTEAMEETTTTEAMEETTTTEATAEMADIVATAEAAGSFTTLLTAVEAAGLTETLMSAGPFTVFAPTDEAFAAIDEETLNGLLADPEALSEVLLYHVVEGAVPASDVVTLDSATTVQGSDVEITVDGDTVMVNDATVVQTDIETSNGIIHVIDSVLLPPSS